ncbi:MAG: glutaconyl-CoA decarboxylase subunit alpha, partial [Desulfobacteraceae bacterium]
MRPYFEKMPDFGRGLSEGQKKSNKENVTQIKEVETQVKAEIEKVKNAGMSTEKINERGEMTVWQRLAYLIDPGTWCPLHTIFNPANNSEGTTNVIDGLGKISGKW